MCIDFFYLAAEEVESRDEQKKNTPNQIAPPKRTPPLPASFVGRVFYLLFFENSAEHHDEST